MNEIKNYVQVTKRTKWKLRNLIESFIDDNISVHSLFLKIINKYYIKYWVKNHIKNDQTIKYTFQSMLK